MAGMFPEDLAAAWNDRPSTALALASNGWSLSLRGDEIADVSYDGVLILRAIRVVVRGLDWKTVPPVLGGVRLRHDGEALELRLTVRHNDGDVHFEWSGTLRLATGALTFGLDGEAKSTFLRNRIGLSVLHPPSIAGTTVVVRDPSGHDTAVEFPRTISPHQPAKNIASLRWNTQPGTAEMDFEGDVFETEDQRNWTDASFKTYSTPLDLPMPVRVAAGERIRQSVTLRAQPSAAERIEPVEQSTAIRLGNPTERIMPEIFVGASTAPGDTPERSGWPRPAGILVELDTGDSRWRAALARSVRDADGTPLDVRIVASTPHLVDPVLAAIEGRSVRRVGVFHPRTNVSEPELWKALETGVRTHRLTAELVGGTRAHFTELNRNQARLSASIPALTFSVTPQMHSVDREQVIESIAMQRVVAENARRIAAGRPMHIGPVTLRARFNAVATTAPPETHTESVDAGYGAEQVPGSTDPRQQGRALAAWLLASVDALTVEGVQSLCYFEAWGPRGIGPADGSHPYPVSLAFAWLASLQGERLVEIAGALPCHVRVLATRPDADSLTVLVANLDDRPHQLEITLPHHDPGGWLERMRPDESEESTPLAAVNGILRLTVGPAQALRWTTAASGTRFSVSQHT